MELEFEDRFFGYEEPLDVVNFLRDGEIEGYCNTLAELIVQFDKKNEDLGITPIVQNEKYGYLMLDYGFAIWALTKFIHNVATNTVYEGNWKEVIQKVKDDFLKDDGSKLTRNGKLFVSLLSYFKLSFPPKGNTFYNKLLCENKTTKQYFLLNTIAINAEPFKKQVGENTFKRIEEIAGKKEVELVAFRAGVNTYITELSERNEETIKLYSFWTQKSGLTRLLNW